MKKINLKLFVFCAIVLFAANYVNAADFNPDTLYSRWIINSRMGDFRNKTATTHFKTATTHFKTATTDRNIE